MKLIEILQDNARYRNISGKKKILYLSNFSMIPIDEVLAYHMRLLGINIEVTIGLLNSPVEQIKKHSYNHDMIIVNIDLFSIFTSIGDLNDTSLEKYKQLEDYYTGLINQVLGSTPASREILLVSVSKAWITNYPSHGSEMNKVIDRCKGFLDQIEQDNVQIVDLDKLINILGHSVSFNEKKNIIDPSPYSYIFTKYLSEIIATYLINRLLTSKKLIILDGDNTLWNGVVAEDGVKQIIQNNNLVSNELYRRVQQKIKFLKEQGIILALCSKNNEFEVLNLFEQKWSEFIELEDFIKRRLNWKPKSINIMDICKELNILPESAVFVDDSLFEINEVLSAGQQITCMQTPINMIDFEIFDWKLDILFGSKAITLEDLRKTKMYMEEDSRQDLARKYIDYRDFLRSLNIKITLSKLVGIDQIDRLLQLSTKTNQFNFLYSRLDKNRIQTMMKDSNYSFYTGSVTDNFGNYGMVELIVVQKLADDSSSARIIEFVLSCRAFGRDIAEQSLSYVIESLKKENYTKIFCGFILTTKNHQFKDFLLPFKFRLHSMDDSNFEYVLQVEEFKPWHDNYPIVEADF